MKILITGGGGFLGFRLAQALLARGQLGGKPITSLTLLDGAFPPAAAQEPRLRAVTGDVSDAKTLAQVCPPDTDAVFHLAAVVSGAAEADFDLGMRVNLKGTELLLETMRRCATPPRLVYTSSVAAFGGVLPAVLDDATIANPQTSYGTQKVIGEYLVSDYSRKGFLDGRSLRLPTIVVRAGKPNAAASSFASGILREPLNGELSECPVAPETGVWLLSPRRVVDAFIHAWELPADAWGTQRWLNLPGITASVAEMLEALKRVAGAKVAGRVVFKPDARIQAIVKTWPVNFRTPRALQMGFRADPDVDTVIRDYLADERIKV
ncbi:MAG: NAD-dependent epimerase/dehydratase family protein [Betaproteobacteria bacterium]|nr:NAD-dependent epimerase/dehydratase family protein [Betaproteobacteria bacterium]MDH5219726.1 NAD-dependent epimerase/dehydratase family protein [Betaproteobacteria bacterium]MDH5350473.1 NAD-dependent epimerase/dehydratase family protein [Betaproteobacteria bacterium]